ncbi:hypothetical protein A7981_10240 [Methylovorus sp. MM2]|nr:hypothetical protein A7981_10240 [Methylovorus sp. MM2]
MSTTTPANKSNPFIRHLSIFAGLAFFMLLTRGSHALTAVAFPDASLAIFLLGGLFLGRAVWFVAFFVLASLIDFGAAALDPMQGFCLTDGYWGLIPAYAVMWMGGRFLGKQQNPFAVMPYSIVSVVTTLAAFVISTQAYYLFSGRFPNHGMQETIQYGWNYLPTYLGYTMMYFAIIWATAQLIRRVRIDRTVQA